ncbi:hypothetical protein ADK36_03840 [Streptomyces viridochromogenes]|nr:hypothetical protein ADK36_03840 [Streptomyces viridochromogenes]
MTSWRPWTLPWPRPRRVWRNVTTRKVIAELAPTGTEPERPHLTTAYQVILNAFNIHPDQAFRVRDLHGLLGMPTDDPAMNVTRGRLGGLTRQGFLTQPGRGLCQKRTSSALHGLESARPTAATLA